MEGIVVFNQVYNSTLRIHKTVLDKLEPWVLKLMARGASRRSATRILAFIINVIPRNHFEPTRLNSQIIWKYFRIRTKWLVEEGILDIEGNYVKGKHCRSYLMSQPFQVAWVKPWTEALSRTEARDYVEDVLVKEDVLLEGDDWIDNVLNLNEDPNDVPLVKAFQFLKQEDVRGYINAYIEKLRNIAHPVNVDVIRQNIAHGVHLVKESQPGSPSWYQGISYILPAQYMLEHTDEEGIFRPEYSRAEIRYFELGLQQLPSGLNKQDVLLEGQTNFDQVGSHAVITRHLFKTIGIDESPLDEYIEDREGLARRLGIDVEALKTATMAILNGATLGLFDKKNLPLSAFAPFLEKYGSFNEATDRFEDFVKWASPLLRHVAELSLQARDLGAPRRCLANIGYVAQVIEFAHKAITVMTSGKELLSDQHDGFILQGSTLNSTTADLLTGVEITYKVKPLGNSCRQCSDQYHYEKRSVLGPALWALLEEVWALSPHLRGELELFGSSLAGSYDEKTVFSGETACFTGGSRYPQTKRSPLQATCRLISSQMTSQRSLKTSGRCSKPRTRSSGPSSLTRFPSCIAGLMSTGYMFTSGQTSQRGSPHLGP